MANAAGIRTGLLIYAFFATGHTTAIGNFEEKDHAAAYAQFRPVYPKKIIDIITSFMKMNNCSGYQCAVDACCGSGQSTNILCGYFDEVTGYDISEEQISHAKNIYSSGQKSIEFKIGDAHSLPIKASSVDLLTCGMAWHWLDAEIFYKEVKRVLKPNGCIAVYGFNTTVTDNELVGIAVEAFKNELIETGCVDERGIKTLNGYKSLQLPFSGVKRFEFDLPQKASIDELIGFMSSITSYRAYCKKLPGNTLLKNIREIYERNKKTFTHCDLERFSYPGYAILGINGL